MYNYGYDYNTAVDTATGFVGIMTGLYLGIMIFSCIIALISIISYAKLFIKAGKPWWASIVPVYNIIVMLEIAKLPMWYIALFFVPIANIYAIFKMNIEMAKRFGKTAGFGVGMTLLSIIFIPLLAFSDNKYEDDNTVSENVNNQFNASDVINNNGSSDNVVSPMENVTLENNPFMPIESAPVEPAIVNEPVANNVVEPAIVNEPLANNVVEPAIVNEPVINNVVETVNEPQVNAFNMAPETNVEPLITENVNETISGSNNDNTTPLVTNLVDAKKVCKNCANELPDIVSICPNCGTDNE